MAFDHEKLDVYREALSFVTWASQFIASVSGKAAAKDQLDRASTSVVLNIAEGNGKFSIRDRCRFLDIAYGSAVECVACLDVYVARQLAQPADVEAGKESLKRIISMLVKLKASLLNRVSEEGVEYE
ncbi:MAG TPA: four helix bundle protein [Armatimonadota bacterium]|nr:four helix bundle protein [Armatimonadota bacterium]